MENGVFMNGDFVQWTFVLWKAFEATQHILGFLLHQSTVQSSVELVDAFRIIHVRHGRFFRAGDQNGGVAQMQLYVQ